MRASSLMLAFATGTTGLVAGVFYGFVVAVNPGLACLPDVAYLQAMQAINDVIQNPVFAASFFGAPLLLPLSAFRYRRQPPARRRFRLLLAATTIYLIGSFGVTVAASIPLNEALARFPVATASPAQAAAARAAFVAPWNAWHLVRTIASLLAFGLAVGACLTPARPSAPGPAQS